MRRLRDAHKDQTAVVVLGGPSLVAQQFDFGRLRRRAVLFLESKALTPSFLGFGVEPDYFLMLFPEKTKDNALQHFVYRAFLAGVGIKSCLNREHHHVVDDMRRSFDRYFEPWRPQRGVHKRFRYRPDVYLEGSPYDLLASIPTARILANRSLIEHYYPSYPYGARSLFFRQRGVAGDFDLDRYLSPVEQDGEIYVESPDRFLNSAAISLYPLLRFMGFREVFFLGMDMSMLGMLEYAAPFTFRSMWHFRWFFLRSRHAYNANFQPNRLFFQRPQSEFEDLHTTWDNAYVRFIRVYDPWKYATPIHGLSTLSVAHFLDRIGSH